MEAALKKIDEKLQEQLVDDMVAEIDSWFGHTHSEHLGYYFVSEMKKEVESLSKERYEFWDKVHKKLSSRLITFEQFAKKHKAEMSTRLFNFCNQTGMKDQPISLYNEYDLNCFRKIGEKTIEEFKKLRGY